MPQSKRTSRDSKGTRQPFSTAEKRALAVAYRAKSPMVCPRCKVNLDEQPVRVETGAVAYVRDRVMLGCSVCHGHAVIDRHG